MVRKRGDEKDTGSRHKNSPGNMAVKQFLTGDFRRVIEKYNALPNAPLVISSLNNELVGWQIIDGLIQSALWSVGAIIFVVAYMTFHMRSLLVTLLGLAHIMISFPVCWCLYTIVFRVRYMGMLNFISMFVLMGIGADDCFVFMDAWRQSRLQPKAISGSAKARMDWTYRRAANAMLITSLTDSVAFYANCISTITVVRVFGIFMGTLVLVNYILVITW